MSYDIEAIKKKIAELSNQNNRGGKKTDGPKLTYFKPTMGPNNVRFLPYSDGDGQPFQQIDYYDCPELAERRIVTPVQWGLPDPVAELVEQLELKRSDDTVWNLMRKLRVKESMYAPVFVRGQEDKGVQIWELNQTVLNQVYGVLAHPDYAEEDMMDPKLGFDFTVTCGDSGKTTTFKGKEYVVKSYDVQARRKCSLLAKTEKERAAIVDSVPNLGDHFKQYVMGEEKLKGAVVNFLSAGAEPAPHSEDNDKETTAPKSDTESEASSKIEDAFKDL